jgi:hypothetical protein
LPYYRTAYGYLQIQPPFCVRLYKYKTGQPPGTHTGRNSARQQAFNAGPRAGSRPMAGHRRPGAWIIATKPPRSRQLCPVFGRTGETVHPGCVSRLKCCRRLAARWRLLCGAERRGGAGRRESRSGTLSRRRAAGPCSEAVGANMQLRGMQWPHRGWTVYRPE